MPLLPAPACHAQPLYSGAGVYIKSEMFNRYCGLTGPNQSLLCDQLAPVSAAYIFSFTVA